MIELFTSQGCSSCPPRRHLAGELVGDEKLIVLSLAVDYWDYLGWHDTLALHSHTQRQKAYAAVRGDRQVYTPQVVIDGIAQRVGSERGSIDRALAEAEGQACAARHHRAQEQLPRDRHRPRQRHPGGGMAAHRRPLENGRHRPRRKPRQDDHLQQRGAHLAAARRLDRRRAAPLRCRSARSPAAKPTTWW